MARATRGGRKTITPETGISAKFDDTEYKEQSVGYDGPPPPAGLYPMRLSSVGQHTTSDTAIVWTFDISEGKYAGWRGWMYSDLDNSKWKTQNIGVALGLMEPEGELNMTYEQILKQAGPVRGRIKLEEYNDEYSPKLQTVIKASASSADDTNDEDEVDKDFDDEPEEEKKPAAKKAAPARRGRAKKESEPEPEDDDEGDEEDEGIDLDALEGELEKLNLTQLKKKAREFKVPREDIKDADEDDLIDLILEKAEEQNPSF